MPDLQDAQASATVRDSYEGERLERVTEGGGRLLLTADLVLEEINRAGSDPAEQAELYRRGEITEPNAVERITRAILRGRGLEADAWRKHAPAVEAVLTHPLDCGCAQCW